MSNTTSLFDNPVNQYPVEMTANEPSAPKAATAARQKYKDIISDPHNILICEKEAAHLLGWDVRTLQQRRYRGQEPPYIRVGRNVRYRLEAILDMVKDGEVLPQRGQAPASRS
ncbi:helix-turn-helix domain-containing protein [Deltaproteobacteria bacterium OttesenSCG-928-K17]|nr:helix-turn-helix domain-containing protein [Deltaproteobacteria bacterium OttesenSCG-928-K17]